MKSERASSYDLYIHHYFPIVRLIRVFVTQKTFSSSRLDLYFSRRKKRIDSTIDISPILSNYRIISTNKSWRLITRLHPCDKAEQNRGPGGGNAFDFASLIDRFRFPPVVTNFAAVFSGTLAAIARYVRTHT